MSETRTWSLAATSTTIDGTTFYLMLDDEQRAGAAFYCMLDGRCSGVRFPINASPIPWISGLGLGRTFEQLRNEFRRDQLNRATRLN
jgi:hypothetical protein